LERNFVSGFDSVMNFGSALDGAAEIFVSSVLFLKSHGRLFNAPLK